MGRRAARTDRRSYDLLRGRSIARISCVIRRSPPFAAVRPAATTSRNPSNCRDPCPQSSKGVLPRRRGSGSHGSGHRFESCYAHDPRPMPRRGLRRSRPRPRVRRAGARAATARGWRSAVPCASGASPRPAGASRTPRPTSAPPGQVARDAWTCPCNAHDRAVALSRRGGTARRETATPSVESGGEDPVPVGRSRCRPPSSARGAPATRPDVADGTGRRGSGGPQPPGDPRRAGAHPGLCQLHGDGRGTGP